MIIDLFINGKKIQAETAPDQMLIDFLRGLGYKSMKRGCDTGNCGLCTVWMDEKPVLSCSVPAARAAGHKITTLEGVQEEAAEFSDYLANEGADQCGYCSPGLIMNIYPVIYADAQDIRDSTAPLQNILEWRSSAKDGKYQICK